MHLAAQFSIFAIVNHNQYPSMAVRYRLVQNKISGHECYGKYYARSIKSGEIGMKEIERIIEQNCSMKRSDVRAVLTELVDTIKDKLQDGYTVDLDELGRLSLGVNSEGVYRAQDFNAKQHISRVVVNYRACAHRRGNGDRRLEAPLAEGCEFIREK